jgi:putative sigma-54 modulation protein
VLTKITARHMDVTDAMKAFVEKKIAKLSKYYNRISETEVIVDKEGLAYKVDLIIKADNRPPFVVHHSGEDLYACVDFAIDKSERQLTKHKEKSRNHKGHASAAEAAANKIESEKPQAEE